MGAETAGRAGRPQTPRSPPGYSPYTPRPRLLQREEPRVHAGEEQLVVVGRLALGARLLLQPAQGRRKGETCIARAFDMVSTLFHTACVVCASTLPYSLARPCPRPPDDTTARTAANAAHAASRISLPSLLGVDSRGVAQQQLRQAVDLLALSLHKLGSQAVATRWAHQALRARQSVCVCARARAR